jgi:hypothetical protein
VAVVLIIYRDPAPDIEIPDVTLVMINDPAAAPAGGGASTSAVQ